VGTSEGLRFKSAKTRGGYVSDVLIRDIKMENVPLPFTFTLNWNPSYSYATIPKEIKNPPPHWVVMNTPVTPIERGYCEFRDIRIENVEVVGAKRVFSASGLPEKPIVGVTFSNITAEGEESGFIEHARDWTMRGVRVKTPKGEPVKITDSVGVESPEVVRK
jgi:polygalacturonase